MTRPPTDWATIGGDIWSRHWRQLDEALSGLAAQLDPVLLGCAPPGPFRGLDIGCGAGATSLALARARPDADLTACDLSPALAGIAEQRLAGKAARVVVGDAARVASREAPFDLLYSRHGVMFFADPPAAFRAFRGAASPGAALVFSCFEDWPGNAWASGLASAAAGQPAPAPGREPGGFAFADGAFVQAMLESAGWRAVQRQPVQFSYIPAMGADAVDEALLFLTEIGPASAVLAALPDDDRPAATLRMREAIEQHRDGDRIAFPAAAAIWTARAA